MLDEHQFFFQSLMQQLKAGFGSGNGNASAPSVIGCKCKNDDTDSLTSLKKYAQPDSKNFGGGIIIGVLVPPSAIKNLGACTVGMLVPLVASASACQKKIGDKTSFHDSLINLRSIYV